MTDYRHEECLICRLPSVRILDISNVIYAPPDPYFDALFDVLFECQSCGATGSQVISRSQVTEMVLRIQEDVEMLKKQVKMMPEAMEEELGKIERNDFWPEQRRAS